MLRSLQRCVLRNQMPYIKKSNNLRLYSEKSNPNPNLNPNTNLNSNPNTYTLVIPYPNFLMNITRNLLNFRNNYMEYVRTIPIYFKHGPTFPNFLRKDYINHYERRESYQKWVTYLNIFGVVSAFGYGIKLSHSRYRDEIKGYIYLDDYISNGLCVALFGSVPIFLLTSIWPISVPAGLVFLVASRTRVYKSGKMKFEW